MIAQQFEQIVRVPLEEASAAKRQAMVQKQRSTQFDQAPDLLPVSYTHLTLPTSDLV